MEEKMLLDVESFTVHFDGSNQKGQGSIIAVSISFDLEGAHREWVLSIFPKTWCDS